jgi:predicted nuclease of predicted toxin-antitoxin system
VAIAAQHLVEKRGLRRILIVDWDLHHGNGTQNAFYTRADILFFSPHQFPYYPGSGHWSEVGIPCAPDSEILAWARQNGFTVLTHDLDFGAILAATGGDSPSVVQLRGQDVMPGAMGTCAIGAIRQFEEALNSGALVGVDARKTRARLLPLR